jgi:hypothetical protein
MKQNLPFRSESRNEGQDKIKVAAYGAQNKSNLSYLNFTFAKGDISGKLMYTYFLFQATPAIIRTQSLITLFTHSLMELSPS